MTERKDGGRAFPLPMAVGPSGDLYDASQTDPGMSLRDWFAGQALQSMCAPYMTALAGSTMRRPPEQTKREIADFSYAIADAMLAARATEDTNDG